MNEGRSDMDEVGDKRDCDAGIGAAAALGPYLLGDDG